MSLPLDRIVESLLILGGFVSLGKIIATRIRSATIGRIPVGPRDGFTILYFWSERCAQCPPQERQISAARDEITAEGVTLTIRKVNAVAEQNFARSMNVLTVPTTLLLDANGRVAAWNPGLTPSRTIVTQLREIVSRKNRSALSREQPSDDAAPIIAHRGHA